MVSSESRLSISFSEAQHVADDHEDDDDGDDDVGMIMISNAIQ